VIASEAIFVLTFVAFAVVRAWNPEIYWGEKTMDFSFLNSVLRGGTFPPYEPWFAGTVLNYYYYGFILVAYLVVLLGTPTALAFNLAMALVPALAMAGAFSIAYSMTRKIRWGVLGATLLGVFGNLDLVYQLWRHGDLAANVRAGVTDSVAERGPLLGTILGWLEVPVVVFRTLIQSPGERSLWDSWWATSRALGEGMINEFPVWSWLFGDLHAHVLVMPISLLVVGLLYAVFLDHCGAVSRPPARRVGVYAALALALGAQFATNAWDFMAYSGFLVVALVAAAIGWSAIDDRSVTERERADRSATPLSPGHVAAPGAEEWNAAPSAEELPASAAAAPVRRRSVVAPLLFVAACAALWPAVRWLHPYWLGLVADWWIGLALGLGLLALGRSRAAVGRLEPLAIRAVALVRRSLVPAALVLVAAIALYYPFHAHLHTGDTALRGNRDGFITAGHALRHFGLFALVTTAWLLATLRRRLATGLMSITPSARIPLAPRTALEHSSPRWLRLLSWSAVAAMVIAILIVSGTLRAASGLCLYALLAAAVLLQGWDPTVAIERRFPALVLGSGWGLAAVSETVVLSDRMNTVFKLYHPAWILLALGSIGCLVPLLESWRWWLTREVAPGSVLRRVARVRPVSTVVALLLAAAVVVALASTWRAVVAVTTLERKVSDRPTLDGVEFLLHTDDEAELAAAMDWLNTHTRGPEVVAEAFTDQGYDDSARVAKYTGLPIVLGWPHHVKQRGRTPEQLQLRGNDLMRLYTSTDAAEVARLCRRYDIRYIFVGELETRVYGIDPSHFETLAVVRPAFRSRTGRYVIYQVELGEPVMSLTALDVEGR
jgi:uncharacterized membrane protein